MQGLLTLGILGLIAWAASKAYAEDTPRRTSAPERGSGLPICEMPAAQIAERSGTQIRSWINCPGRLNTQVLTLVSTLQRSGENDTAAAVLDRWTARRNIDTATPDGTLAPEARREVDQAMRATPTELRGPAYDPTPTRGVERDAQGGRISPPPRRESRAIIQTVESIQPAPSYFNPQLARNMAGPVSRHVASLGRRYDRARVRAFQRAAGFVDTNQHGLYDCKTRNALSHFGIQDPPTPLLGITRNCDAHPYVPPTR